MADRKEPTSIFDSAVRLKLVDNGDGSFSLGTSSAGSSGGGGAVAGDDKAILSFTANYTTAQTNQAVVSAAAGTHIVVTSFMVTAANSNTVDVAVSLGLGAATVPTGSQQFGQHPGIAPGSGFGRGSGAGIIAEGADDQDVRITSGVPTGGSISVSLTYYIDTP